MQCPKNRSSVLTRQKLRTRALSRSHVRETHSRSPGSTTATRHAGSNNCSCSLSRRVVKALDRRKKCSQPELSRHLSCPSQLRLKNLSKSCDMQTLHRSAPPLRKCKPKLSWDSERLPSYSTGCSSTTITFGTTWPCCST